MDFGVKDDADEYTVEVEVSPTDTTVRDVYAGPLPSNAEPAAMGFVFLDAGGWYGDAGTAESLRDFAVIHGNWVALCSFVGGGGNFGTGSSIADFEVPPKGLAKSAPVAAEVDPADGLLQALSGSDGRVHVKKSIHYCGTYARGFPAPVVMVLGDMHMPLLRGMPPVLREGSDGPLYAIDGIVAGRREYVPPPTSPASLVIDRTDASIDNTSPPVLYASARDWFELYNAQDIYKSAGLDTLEILTRFESFQSSMGVGPGLGAYALQVGDLLDFSIGFDRFWEPNEAHEVVPVTASSDQMSGAEFVKFWCDRVSDADNQLSSYGVINAQVLRKLSELDGTILIQGNHDNYLALPHPLNIGPQRVRTHLDDGFWVEHGHEPDSWNVDGSWKGHFNAQFMMAHPGWRWVGNIPDLRGPFVSYAAEKWHGMGSSRFAVFAMGHTHCANLSWVNVREVSPQRGGPPI